MLNMQQKEHKTVKTYCCLIADNTIPVTETIIKKKKTTHRIYIKKQSAKPKTAATHRNNIKGTNNIILKMVDNIDFC